jgi:hypothetical protein
VLLHEKVIVPDARTADAIAQIVANGIRKYRANYRPSIGLENYLAEMLSEDLSNYGITVNFLSKGIGGTCSFRNGQLQLSSELLGHSYAKIAATIKHELVHRGQYDRIRRSGNWPKYSERKNTPYRDDSSNKTLNYYGNKHELMAYANTAVHELAAKMDKAKVLDYLRTLNDVAAPQAVPSETIQTYALNVKKQSPELWNRFLRYAYAYATQLSESHRSSAEHIVAALLSN